MTVASHRSAHLGVRLVEELKRNNLAPLNPDQALQDVGFIKLYRDAIEQLDAQIAQGQGHAPMRKEEVDLMCRCLLSCANLEEAIRCAADFCTMLTPRAGRLSLEVDGPFAHFHMDSLRPKRSSAACIVDLTGLFCYLQMFSWLIAEPLSIDKTFIGHPERADAVPFLSLFNAPAIVGQPTYGFSFAASQLKRTIVRQPAELADFLVDFPFRLVISPSTATLVSQQVRFFLQSASAHGQSWPTLEAIAHTLNQSPATLRRRLKSEGHSYQTLRQACLCEAAVHYLKTTQWPISRIAEYLGFSNEAAFRRAFHNWTGAAPSQYRR